MIQDIKDKKINAIAAFKLDRLIHSVYDIGKLMKFVNDMNVILIAWLMNLILLQMVEWLWE